MKSVEKRGNFGCFLPVTCPPLVYSTRGNTARGPMRGTVPRLAKRRRSGRERVTKTITRCQILGRLICHPLAFKKPSKIKGRKVPLKKARVFRAPLSSAGGRSPRTGAQRRLAARSLGGVAQMPVARRQPRHKRPDAPRHPPSPVGWQYNLITEFPEANCPLHITTPRWQWPFHPWSPG